MGPLIQESVNTYGPILNVFLLLCYCIYIYNSFCEALRAELRAHHEDPGNR